MSGGVLSPPARQLMLIVLVAACGVPRGRSRRPSCLAVALPSSPLRRSHPPPDLSFRHLTTEHGLSQDHVVAILQDHRGFMWFATGEGLNRYDGNSFVVYKNDPSDPGSLSHNFIRDVFEDDQGYLWVAAYPVINKFDPRTERSTRYRHDPNNPKSFSGDSVESITSDSRGHLWFATADTGLDRFDPATETFTNYRNDSDGRFVGRVRRVIEDSRGDIWFVADRGLFHLNPQTGQITRPPGTIEGFAAIYLYEDGAGDFWMLASSPNVGLVKYQRQAERVVEYPLGAGATILDSSTLLDDGEQGFWVPSSVGLSLLRPADRTCSRASFNTMTPIRPASATTAWSRFTAIDPVCCGWRTANRGLNIIDLRQRQFRHYTASVRPAPIVSHPARSARFMRTLMAFCGLGFFPRALDRLDRKTGRITHYVPGTGNGNGLSKGSELNTILKDARGHLWVGGLGAGLDRFDERSGRFKHYAHDPGDPNSLMTDDVICIYGDPSGQLWVGQFGGVSRFDPATDRFTNYRPGPDESASLAYSVSAIHRDRSGTLWVGTWGGILSRFDEKTNTFVHYTPDRDDPRKLQGGSIGAIHEDSTGTLWLAAGLGLYRFDRKNELFTRYTESDGLPSNDLMGILEDAAGRLWISSKKGISRFDPQTERSGTTTSPTACGAMTSRGAVTSEGGTARCSSAATRGLPRSSRRHPRQSLRAASCAHELQNLQRTCSDRRLTPCSREPSRMPSP